MNIYDLISRAQKLREETKLDSVSPDRVGALCEDTLKYINEFQLLASSPSLHKSYASVSAMQADKSPKSDLTGKALKPGQLVVIVPANQSDATAGDVYRYDGPSGNTSAWTFVAKIGGVPADAELNASSTNPVQNKAVTEKLTELLYGIEGALTELESQSELIEDLQNTKIDKEADDYYPQLSVGIADNLAGHEDATPSEIGFRRSGGGAILDGNARIEAIKGNSVVWNQLSTTTELNESKTTESLPLGASIVQGHKYAIIFESSNARLYLYSKIDGSNKVIASSQDGKSLIFTSNYSATSEGSIVTGLWWFVLYLNSEITAYSAKKIRLIDITKAYPNDWRNINTIEELYACKPLGIDEYAYNEGEVINMDVQSIESVGVNQWDEEWEVGTLSSIDGLPTTSASAIRIKDFIKMLPSSDYYVTAPTEIQGNIRLFFYDADKNFIKRRFDINDVFTTPSNAHYMKLIVGSTTTYNHDICINLSDPSVNGKYFPYVKREQSLDIIGKYFPNGMGSINKSCYDEFRYIKQTNKREAVQRIGEVDLGTLNWFYNESEGMLYAPDGRFYAGQPLICSRYINRPGYDNDGNMYAVKDNLRIFDFAYTDAATFKAAMQGVMLYYELAEPIITEIEETINLDYEVWNVGTEKAIANVPSTPLKADIIYGFNAYGVIKELLARVASLEAANASLASQLASVTSHNEEV